MNAPAGYFLSPVQKTIVDQGLLSRPSILNLPTNSGKTFFARMAIAEVVKRGGKALYLCPLRALATELGQTWKEDFGHVGLGVYTGEHGVDQMEDNPSPSEAQVLILTPEKLDIFVRMWGDSIQWLSKVDLVVVDEIHTLDSGRRGATLEGVITRLRCINPFVRVLGLSATLGNPQELAQWVGGDAFVTTERSLPLNWSIRTFKNSDDKQGLTIAEVEETIADAGQVIVFVQSRPKTETLAKAIRSAGFTAEAHHAGMSPAARRRVEGKFRARQLNTIVATPTLAIGLNLPARKVVLFDLQRWDGDGFADLSCNEIWQMGGRAGRRGLDSHGEVVLMSPKFNQVAARRFIQGRFEPIQSDLRNLGPSFREQVLVSIGSRIALNANQAARVIGQSFWGFNKPQELVAEKVNEAIGLMKSAGMLEDSGDAGFLRATRLGRIAVRFQLSPETVIAFSKLATSLPDATMMDILMTVCSSPDFTAKIRMSGADAQALKAKISREPLHTQWIKENFSPAAQRDVGATARTALALRAWTRLGNDDEAAEYVGANAHEVEEARKEAVRIIQALNALLEDSNAKCDLKPADGLFAEYQDGPSLKERVKAIGAMVCGGLDHEAATLCLVDGIGPVLARKLMAHGFASVEELALATPQDLVAMGGVSESRATKWIAQASGHISVGGAFRYSEVPLHQAHAAESSSPHIKGLDPNRWHRAKLLQVTQSGQTWVVSGGIDAHVVDRQTSEEESATPATSTGLRCDCHDAAKGSVCKHQIAVLAALGDPRVPPFAAEYPAGEDVHIDILFDKKGR